MSGKTSKETPDRVAKYGPYVVRIDPAGPQHYINDRLYDPGAELTLPPGQLPYSIVESTDEQGKKSYSRDFGFLEVISGDLPDEADDPALFSGVAASAKFGSKAPVDPKTGKRAQNVDL